jgi:ABC-type branched-subunit amino acid transport system substrate-binding protein
MRRLVAVLVLLGVVLALVVVVAPAARAQSGGGATEVGVTKTTVRIGVVADVDSPLAPGLFQGVVDGVRGAAKYLNSKAGGGGVAGRKVVVDFLDSKLNPTTSRNAVITACSQDYALVGTAAIFLTNFDDAVACKDQRGAETGLPDFGAVTSSVEGCTPISFPVNPPNVLCDTMTRVPQTYQTNQRLFTYLQQQRHHDLHGALIYTNDTKGGAIASQVLIEGPPHAGVKVDQKTALSARATQSEYTPVIQQMKADGSNFAYTVTSSSGAVALMSEAQLQGLTDPDIAWTCTTACYDATITDNAKTTNGLYIYMTFLPFAERGANPMLANFVKYVGADKVNGFAVYGWAATLAWAQAAEAGAKQEKGAMTRVGLLDGAKTLTAFDAGGMLGTTDIAHKRQTPCTAILQLRDGKWVRLAPKRTGTFDCRSSNHIEFQADFANQ